MSAPAVGVLALQGDVREHLVALTECGAEARPVRRPAELEHLDGIVLPGGESTTIDKLAVIFELRDPLIAALRGGLPAYGSCAGMILLANEVLDGTADQRTFGGWSGDGPRRRHQDHCGPSRLGAGHQLPPRDDR